LWQYGEDKGSIIPAIESGNIEYISWVISKQYEVDTDTIFCTCSMYDNLEIFEKFIKLGYMYPHNSVDVAAAYNSTKLLEWFIQNNVDTSSLMCILSEYGFLDTIKFIVEKYNISCDQNTLNCASTGECVETIEYLLNNHNCTVGEDTIYHSSCSSNTEVRNYFQTRYPELLSGIILDIRERYS